MASGEILKSQGSCTQVLTAIQNTSLSPSYYVLPLAGCDIVLGIQWLRGLGPITWDFSSLSMKFLWEGMGVHLKGLQLRASTFTNEGDKGLVSAFHKGKGLLLQLIVMQSEGPKESRCPAITELMEQFDRVFQEPLGLPPTRSHDHKIVLKEGTNPISTRPYRYPHYQKAEIEKIVTKLLTNGVIRPSCSPFFISSSVSKET